MFRKIISGIMLILLVLSMFTLLSHVQPVRASGTIIRAKGSIDPSTMLTQNNIADALSVPPPTEWNKTYGGIYQDCAYSMIQTSDGGYALAGSTNSFGSGVAPTLATDFWLVKTDSVGKARAMTDDRKA